MNISFSGLEDLICEIIADCATVTPPLDRNEIASHVIDHLGPELRKQIYAALERMTATGTLSKLAPSPESASPLRYGLPAPH